MDPLQLWAGVRFAAQNGNTGGLLTAAAQNGLHLSAITAQPGGFCARCAAWRYPELSRLARRYRVRLRVQKRDGLFFRLRPLLRRRGLWAAAERRVFVSKPEFFQRAADRGGRCR